MTPRFKQLLEILSPDNVFIPKALLARHDICDEAKLLFAEILTDNRFLSIDGLKSEMNNVPNEIFNLISAQSKKHSAKQIKSDFLKIYTDLDTILLVSETEELQNG